MRGMQLCATMAVLAFLTGCNSTRDFNVEHHTLGTSEALATDASARLVSATPIVGGVDSTGRFKPHQINCAEPSPDVAKAIESAFSSGVTIDVTGKTTDMPADLQARLANSIAQSRSEALAQLTERLPTIQLLRDGLFRACEAYANGTLSPISYSLVLSRYGDTLVTMLGSELIAGTYGHQLATAGGTSSAHATATLAAPTTTVGAAAPSDASADASAAPADGSTTPGGTIPGAQATDAQTNTTATASAVQGNGTATPAGTAEDPAARARIQAEIVEAYLSTPSASALVTACITALDRAPSSIPDGQSKFAEACQNQPGGTGLLQQSLNLMSQQVALQGQIAVIKARQDAGLASGQGTGLGGSVVDQVIAAQTALQRRGLYGGQIDGLAAGKTIEAIRKFQSGSGLPPTGQLDPTTMRLLVPSQS